MFGIGNTVRIKNLEYEIKGLMSDVKDLNDKYWELATRFNLLCDFIGVEYEEISYKRFKKGEKSTDF